MPELQAKYGLLSIPDNQNDMIVRFIREYGEWAWDEVSFLATFLPGSGARVLDVGSYLGTFALGISQLRSLEYLCCVEANPSIIPLLSTNVTRNFPGRHTIKSALVASSKEKQYIGISNSENMGGTEFSAASADSLDSDKSIKPNQVCTLADLRIQHGPFDLIKLDVEGMEFDVLSSDADFVRSGDSTFWIECNDNIASLDVGKLLLDLGVEIYYFAFPCHNPENTNGNRNSIYPFAFEAGFLVSPKREVVVDETLQRHGCILRRIHTLVDLKEIMWLTPRWGMHEWEGAKVEHLAARLGRQMSGQDFSTYLTPEAIHKKNSKSISFSNEFIVALTKHPSAQNLVYQYHRQSIETDLTLQDLRARISELETATVDLEGAKERAEYELSRALQRPLRYFLRHRRKDTGKRPSLLTRGLAQLPKFATIERRRSKPRQALSRTAPMPLRARAKLTVLDRLIGLDHIFSERQIYKFRRSREKLTEKFFRRLSIISTNTGSGYVGKARLFSHPGGFRADVLRTLRPLDQEVADWKFKKRPSRATDIRSLERTFSSQPASGRTLLSISHDDYRKSTGGIQLCIANEQRLFTENGHCYIHLWPAQPLPILSSDKDGSSFFLQGSVNAQDIGTIAASDLIGLLGSFSRSREIDAVVHSLLGHSPEIAGDILESVTGKKIFWLHDYFSLCPSFTLMRNKVSYCAAPHLHSTGCSICLYGDERLSHVPRIASFFDRINPVVVSPSETALQIWQRVSPYRIDHALICEHCSIRTAPMQGSPPTGSHKRLRVAYLGHAVTHKGWPLFVSIASSCSDGPYQFYHLGQSKSDDVPEGVQFHSVRVSPENPNAMKAAIEKNEIDIAFICPLWPETYNFTSIEALSGGAMIATLRDSGNVASIVQKYNAGWIFETEEELIEAFESGRMSDMYRQADRRTTAYDCELRGMTYDILHGSPN